MSYMDFDASVQHSFGLDIDGGVPISIMEVKGLKFEMDVVDMPINTPTGQFMIKKLPGRPKAAEITLVRPKDRDDTFEKWMTNARDGKMSEARKNGSIIEFDYTAGEAKRWNFERAWPKSYEISDLKAGATDPRTETLVIVAEELKVG